MGLASLGLTACQGPRPDGSFGPTLGPGGTVESGPVAILLPLTGRLAEIGKPMLRAAQLALSVPGSPILIVKDTAGSPDAAAQAAEDAIAEGARLILGPVTAAETGRVAGVARRGRVPVLAFTNDQAQSQPNVWTLGITPGQQVRRLVVAAAQSNKTPVAALLPDNDFGRAMAEELNRAAAGGGPPPPFIRMHGPGKDSITAVVNELAGTAGPEQVMPFGSILLGAVGADLKFFAVAFPAVKIDTKIVQIMGPGLWIDPASGSGVLAGAWCAAPDPAARQALIRDYNAKYKEPPRPVADLAYDGGSIARVLAAQGRMNVGGLTQPAGFAGVDGLLTLLPDGQVRRSLSLFRVERRKVVKIADAPSV